MQDFVSNIDSKSDDDILEYAKYYLGEHDYFTRIKEKKTVNSTAQQASE